MRGVIDFHSGRATPPIEWRDETRGDAMNGQGQTKLIYPGLAGFYEKMMPIAATLVRVVVGIMFLMHVSGKFKIGA